MVWRHSVVRSVKDSTDMYVTSLAMASDDITFEFNECPIRVRVADGEPRFRGNDVAAALGYAVPRNALREHVDKRDKSVQNNSENRGHRQIIDGGKTPPCDTSTADGDADGRASYNAPVYINISGVNALVLGSKLSCAVKVKHWITSVVMPAIQLTGEYRTPRSASPLRPDGRSDAKSVVELRAENATLQARLEVAELRVENAALAATTAELRAELAASRAQPSCDPVEVARVYADVTKTYAMVATSDCFSAIDKIFFHDRLKNSLAGTSATSSAVLTVDLNPGATPTTTDRLRRWGPRGPDRLLVPLSDSVLKVTGCAFDRKDYCALGKLAAGYRQRHGGTKPSQVSRFVDGGMRMVNAYGGDDVVWIENDVIRPYYATRAQIGRQASAAKPINALRGRKRPASAIAGPAAKRAITAAGTTSVGVGAAAPRAGQPTTQVSIKCYTKAS
jgi:prophage antirepressor-like protein